MSNDNHHSHNGSSRPWAIYYKQEKDNLEEINENLVQHLENLEKENVNYKKLN